MKKEKRKVIKKIINTFIGSFLISYAPISGIIFLLLEKKRLTKYGILKEMSDQIFNATISMAILLLILFLINIIILFIKRNINKELKAINPKNETMIISVIIGITLGFILGLTCGYKVWSNSAYICPCGNHPRFTDSLGDTM